MKGPIASVSGMSAKRWLVITVRNAAPAAPAASHIALRGPAPGDLRIVATATPVGKRSRSISISCLRSGTITTMPMNEPAMAESTIVQKL